MGDKTERIQGDIWDAVTRKVKPGEAWALRVSRKGEVLRSVRFDPETTYIGRMAENHVVLDDPQVSRSHARITASEKGWLLEDQESENGVFVNGTRVNAHTLQLGDEIRIGSHLLEVVPAEGDARVPVPGEGLDEPEEEFRMNQTVNITGDALESLRASGFQTAKKASKKDHLPTLDFSLNVGETSYEKSVTFQRGRKRAKGDGEGNFAEIRICLGPWVMSKKVPL